MPPTGPDSGSDEGRLRPTAPSGRVTTPDGVGVAYYDFGGGGPPLLLVHATGFCGPVLAPMAVHLRRRFHCVALDLRAHGASDPPPDGDFDWHGFAADVLGVVDLLGLARPSGFGHSCGGAALLLAEEARPGTFAALYCFEPVVYPGDDPPAPTIEGNPLAIGALRRRQEFASRRQAIENFEAKAPFDRLSPDALAAYVDNGFTPVVGGGIASAVPARVGVRPSTPTPFPMTPSPTWTTSGARSPWRAGPTPTVSDPTSWDGSGRAWRSPSSSSSPGWDISARSRTPRRGRLGASEPWSPWTSYPRRSLRLDGPGSPPIPVALQAQRLQRLPAGVPVRRHRPASRGPGPPHGQGHAGAQRARATLLGPSPRGAHPGGRPRLSRHRPGAPCRTIPK